MKAKQPAVKLHRILLFFCGNHPEVSKIFSVLSLHDMMYVVSFLLMFFFFFFYSLFDC